MMKNQQIFKSAAGRQAILEVYDSILKRWPVPYESLSVNTQYGQTYVQACGADSAPPLILLHGSSTNSAMWIGDVSTYCQGYRVYALDIPGEPGKSEALRFDLNSPEPALWLAEVFAALHIERAVLLGISLGGWLALKFATTYPERVTKLVLLCPAGVAPQKVSFMLQTVGLMFFGQWGLERLIKIVNGGQSIALEALEYTRLIANNFNPRIESLPIFSDQALKRLEMPVRLIVGEKDALLPSRNTVARLSNLLPHLTATVLPDSGHVLINLAAPIMDFLVAEDMEKAPQCA
jgi:pimeloyl-ACP methyl ester carboxylesterase